MSFRYHVRLLLDESLKADTDSLEMARSIAIAMGHWNTPCVVTDTATNEIVFETRAFRDHINPTEPPTLGVDVKGGEIVFLHETKTS